MWIPRVNKNLQREVLYGSIRAIRLRAQVLVAVIRLSAVTLTIEIKQIGGSWARHMGLDP